MEVDELYQQIMLRDKEIKKEKYERLNRYVKKQEILFVGSSLMEDFPIVELLMNNSIEKVIYNRAISGYTTNELIQSLETCIFELEPSKIFINIGSNDIASEAYTVQELLKNYKYILNEIKKTLPFTNVFLMAYYPVNELDDFIGRSDKSWFSNRNNYNISDANKYINELAKEFGYTYIDLNQGLMDERGQLIKEFSIDGIHMYASGYNVVFHNMLPYL